MFSLNLLAEWILLSMTGILPQHSNDEEMTNTTSFQLAPASVADHISQLQAKGKLSSHSGFSHNPKGHRGGACLEQISSGAVLIQLVHA